MDFGGRNGKTKGMMRIWLFLYSEEEPEHYFENGNRYKEVSALWLEEPKVK